MEIKKSVLGSVRLDSDVWEAVRKMDCSLNQYLREALLGKGITPEIEAKIAANVRPRKVSKRQKVVNELAASDVTARALERDDIEYGLHTELPKGEHVANLRPYKAPLLKPSEKKK